MCMTSYMCFQVVLVTFQSPIDKDKWWEGRGYRSQELPSTANITLPTMENRELMAKVALDNLAFKQNAVNFFLNLIPVWIMSLEEKKTKQDPLFWWSIYPVPSRVPNESLVKSSPPKNKDAPRGVLLSNITQSPGAWGRPSLVSTGTDLHSAHSCSLSVTGHPQTAPFLHSGTS